MATSTIELQIIGDLPENLDLRPVKDMMSVLNSRSSELKLPAGEVNLTFVDDAEMRALNLEYSGNDYATDVLSFSYLESGGAIEDVIGEMVISYETAARQAEATKMTLAEEVALLSLHGILHIVGYDHQSADEQARLQALQASIMSEAKLNYREFVWEQ